MAKNESKESKNSNVAGIVIAVLITIIVCAAGGFIALLATGILKFNTEKTANTSIPAPTDIEPVDNEPAPDTKTSTTTDTNPFASRYHDETLVGVDDLSFYLPDDFEFGELRDGVYVYNLVDDDGWADVKVYSENSNLTAASYINDVIKNTKVVDYDQSINGTSWTRAESSDNILVFATKVDNHVYCVLLTIKLESEDTREAWSMISRTLYIKD